MNKVVSCVQNGVKCMLSDVAFDSLCLTQNNHCYRFNNAKLALFPRVTCQLWVDKMIMLKQSHLGMGYAFFVLV